ncbi:DNA-binding protein, 42 kDa containing protein [Brugia malayi]|uniref:Bm6238 n=2 Tax=Brugia TaxID=6278 RepID=A0A0K0JMB2_BRUMA|nr:DNA-binding protein, 42 kDa containing protein [Brugia malayi]CRZ22038.1 Bm6238 [Brugia malayi]VIO87743.1 DNA-binding protein, 42 kDa containing protein [Brugia malayi]
MAEKGRQTSPSSESNDDEKIVMETPASDLVVTKYAMAADIVNAVLRELITATKDGVEVGEICDLGDRLMNERLAKVFKKEKDTLKGIAMPTCISINNCVCHFSPLRSDPPIIIKDGQMVKIDLGAHIDGFIATVAHTVVVGASLENKIKGRMANVMLAAYNAMEAAVRMLRPGLYKNIEITDMIDKIANIYKVRPVENMLSHELRKNKIDGEKQIIQNPGEKQRSEMTKCSFEKFEVYAIDILMSTGEGKTRILDSRTTVYKKVDDLVYSLKVKASRMFLSAAVNKYGLMPFTLRSFEDEKLAKMGVVECERHNLMRPYQVFYERDGEYVAQFKSTVLIMPNGLLKITGFPLDMNTLESDVKIEDQLITSLLNSSLKPKKAKKKPKSDKKDENNGTQNKDGIMEQKGNVDTQSVNLKIRNLDKKSVLSNNRDSVKAVQEN